MFGDITNVARMAKAHWQYDKDVIDATIGVFYGDDGTIGYSKTFEKVRAGLHPNERYNYGAVSGGKEFEENVIKWVFNNERPTLSHRVCATMGATGALSNIFALAQNEKAKVLVSDLYWHNYLLMAEANGLDLELYEMFNKNKLTFDDFIIKANKLINSQKHLYIVINNPAHNPSGYSFTKDEMNTFINIINELSKQVLITLIFDIAYLDLDRKASHFELLNNITENITIFLTYSFSKSLGLYGLRLGALIVLAKNPLQVKELFAKLYVLARTKWSSPNQEAIATFNEILSNDLLINNITSEIEVVKKTLLMRSTLLLKELLKTKVTVCPYQQGFFITILCDNSLDLWERLKTRKVYVIPLKKGIRIAIASLSPEKINRLAKHLVSELA